MSLRMKQFRERRLVHSRVNVRASLKRALMPMRAINRETVFITPTSSHGPNYIYIFFSSFLLLNLWFRKYLMKTTSNADTMRIWSFIIWQSHDHHMMTQGSVGSLYDCIFGFQKIFGFLKWEYHDHQMKHVSGQWSVPTSQITKVDLSDLYSSEFTSHWYSADGGRGGGEHRSRWEQKLP